MIKNKRDLPRASDKVVKSCYDIRALLNSNAASPPAQTVNHILVLEDTYPTLKMKESVRMKSPTVIGHLADIDRPTPSSP